MSLSNNSPNLNAELYTRVGIALSLQQLASLRKLEFTVENGIVTLAGRVNSSHEHQLAIAVVGKVVGVRRVVDEIKFMEIIVPHSAQASEPAVALLWRKLEISAGSFLGRALS